MKILFLILVLSVLSQGQILRKDGFRLQKNPAAIDDGLLGNGIVDLLVAEDKIWAGTGYGLNMTMTNGDQWQNFTSADYIGKGGVTAMAIQDENTLWLATSFDTLTADAGTLPAGGGLSYTRDAGASWTHIPQPVDNRNETDYKPTTTTVQNLTFDIGILDSTIWIASFGGGLRKSDNMGQTWQVVTTDSLPFSALDNLNHRVFSIMTENGNVWVGSAAGISKSTDRGVTWQRMTHANQEFPISGNFIVALAHQPQTGTTWAATIETDTSEIRAVSKSDDGGQSWQIMLEGIFPHNFAFDGNRVYVAADEGMYISDDGGENWYLLPHIMDSVTGEEILTQVYYSAAVSDQLGAKTFWAGSADGLAATSDNGNSWSIYRSFQSTKKSNTPDAYAYPSPFSPSRQEYVRFQYDLDSSGPVLIEIFDFAMDKVATIRDYKTIIDPGESDRSSKWNGRTDTGMVVASGVYVFRVQVDGKTTWGKIVIIN